MTKRFQKIIYYRYAKKISKKEARYYISLIRECIEENEEIKQELERYYKKIVVYIFKTGKEKQQLKVQSDYFNRKINTLGAPSPAHATSEMNKGLIIINTDKVIEVSDKRIDIKPIENLHKLMMFEEICHLIEQKGNTLTFPSSAEKLFVKYSNYLKALGKSPDIGLEIIKKLRSNRNHYEVYKMMIKYYPTLFFERFSTVFWEEGNYNKKYYTWKENLNKNIALARLLSDNFLRKILFIVIGDYEKYGIEHNKISLTLDKCKNALEELNQILDSEKPELLEQLENIDELIFETHESFFDYVYYLWEKNGLLE